MYLKHFTSFFIALSIFIIVSIIGVSLYRKSFTPPYNINTKRAAVIKQMQELNRIETASFTIEKIIDAGTTGSKLKNFLFGDKILLIAHGKVIAGFDLSTISQDDVKIDGKNLTVRLPKPQILITSIDNSQTRVYDRTQGILSTGQKDLESEARQAAEKSITDAACQAGILKQATDSARKQLTAFFGALGFENVTLEIPQGSC